MLSASSNAIRTCEYKWDREISFENLHKRNKREIPVKMMSYRHALQLYKVYNSEEWSEEWSEDWVDLNWQQNFNNGAAKCK